MKRSRFGPEWRSPMKSKLLIALLASLFAGGAFAQAAPAAAPDAGADHSGTQDKRKAKFEERFKAADTNGDGVIGKDEASKMPGLSKHFDRLDANKDGKLTREELLSGHARGHGKQQGGHAAKFEERFKVADKD